MHRTFCVWLVALFCATATTFAAEPDFPPRATILRTLASDHPRLLAHRADFEQLAAQCQQDEHAGRWLERLREQADKLLAQLAVKYEIPDGKRLLAVSRQAKDRLLLLGLMHQLTGERKYAERAWVELAAVTQFRDWNPSHFLDTAEMTFAVSIGYDWLYDAWTDEQRAQLRTAIVRHGLTPGMAVYRKGSWWAKSKHNWNQVCNGGMGVGALAIGDVEPDLASEVLHAALRSLPLAMHEFAPDGGWGEGPGYWHYATEYNVYLLAALQSALGTDFGFCQMPGFAQTGDFPIYMVGPTGKSFNYADASEGWRGAAQSFWLATQFGNPTYAARQIPYADTRTTPLDLLWGAKWLGQLPSQVPPQSPLPLARCFRGVQVTTMRSAWNDPQALFVACKGGDNRVNHAHLDLGTFVLDALGERWAIDIGPDNYNLPGYFGRERWDYVRNNTLSHNAVLIDGQSQRPDARAEIVRLSLSDDQPWIGTVIDLSHAWPQAQQVQRGVALIDRRQVLVQDEIIAQAPVESVWQMLTDAQIKIDGPVATLIKGDRRLQATLLSPAAGSWSVAELVIPTPQRPAKNVRKLLVTTPKPLATVRYAVVFQPVAESPASPPSSLPLPALTPLAKWPGETAGR